MRILHALALGAMLLAPAALQARGGHGTPARPTGIHPDALVVPGRIIVKLKPGQTTASLKSALATLQAGTPARIYPHHQAPNAEQQRQGWVDLSRIYEVKFSAPFRTEAALQAFRTLKAVEYAEPRYMHKTCYTTNDPRRSNQPHLLRIKAAEAWDVHKGDTNTVVGIIDSGVDWDHPDIVGNVAYNRADPIDGVDNDNDGFIDNYRGWDLAGADYNNVAGDNNPAMTAANNNHGSHVAGCAAASTDNGVGVAAPGFRCRLLPVKCAADNDTRGPGGVGYILTGYEGITYAADHGCSVINCSWGGAGLSSYENDIINYATFNKNALVVAAAGNNNSGDDFFPACFNNVLAVAATNSTNDNKASFSNYNSRVSVSAPGVNVFSTIFNDSYQNMSGTSMASPVVAGACALLRSYLPTLTPAQVIQQVRVTSDDIYSLPQNSSASLAGKLGKGRLNMFRMLTERTPGIALKNYRVTDGNDQYFEAGDTLRLRASFINRLFAASGALTATFTTTSNYATIDPATEIFTLGPLGTGDSTSQSGSDELRIVINPGAPADAAVILKITFDDGQYTDFTTITLNLNSTYVNFMRNNIGSTVASNGRLGYAGEQQTNGLGVQLLGWGNLVYEIGQLTARSAGAAVTLASSVRGDNQSVNNDFTPVNNTKPISGIFAPHEYAGSYSSSALGLEYRHHSYVWDGGADTGFYIHEYEMKNTGASAVQNLYTGFYADPDVSDGGVNDVSEWDSIGHIGYVMSTDSLYSVQGGPYMGIALLTRGVGYQFMPIVNDGSSGAFGVYDGFSDAEQYLSLSSGISSQMLPLVGRKDVSMSAGYGPISLGAGESKRLGYAICVGYTLDELRKAAARADSTYQSIATAVAKPVASSASVQVFPNPANHSVTIAAPGLRQVSVTDLRGTSQPVQVQLSSDGARLDLGMLAPGTYLVRVQTPSGLTFRRFVKQ